MNPEDEIVTGDEPIVEEETAGDETPEGGVLRSKSKTLLCRMKKPPLWGFFIVKRSTIVQLRI